MSDNINNDYVDIIVNSVERTTGSSSDSFSIAFPNNALPRISRIKLMEINMLNTTHNIITGYNDVITFSDSGGNHTYTISEDSYDITTLCSILSAGLTSASGAQTYTVAITKTVAGVTFNTLKVTITCTGACTFTWAAGSPYKILGFNLGTTASSTTQSAPNVFNMFPFTSLYMTITEFQSIGFSAGSSNDKFTFCIPINVNTGEWLGFTEGETYEHQVKGINNLSSISISLLVAGQRVLSLNGQEWSMILRIYK